MVNVFSHDFSSYFMQISKQCIRNEIIYKVGEIQLSISASTDMFMYSLDGALLVWH